MINDQQEFHLLLFLRAFDPSRSLDDLGHLLPENVLLVGHDCHPSLALGQRPAALCGPGQSVTGTSSSSSACADVTGVWGFVVQQDTCQATGVLERTYSA